MLDIFISSLEDDDLLFFKMSLIELMIEHWLRKFTTTACLLKAHYNLHWQRQTLVTVRFKSM